MSLRRSPRRDLLIVVSVIVMLVVGVAAPAYAAPANDNLGSAQTLSGIKGIVYGTAVGATVQPDCEPSKSNSWPYVAGEHTVWYRWTAPAHGWVRFGVKAYGGWTAHAAAFQYFGGCGAGAMAWAASDSPGYGQMTVERGQTVLFAVYGLDAAVGTFGLGWRFIQRPAPLNDRFAASDVLWGRYGKAAGTNINATRESGEPLHAGRAGGRSVWFRWTAVASGPAMFHLGGPSTSLDCLLAVYTGTSVGALSRVAADAGTWTAGSCTARFTATAGTTYRIAVDGDGGDERMFQIFWNSGPPPANDNAVDAQPLTGFAGSLDGTNRGATDEWSEPRHVPTRGGSSVWYRWTAPDDGAAGFAIGRPPLYQPSDEMEDFKRVAVFTGTPPAGLTLRGESKTPPTGDQLVASVPVTAGSTYWIQVTGVDEEAVHYTLDWWLLPQSNDEFSEPMTLPPTGTVAVNTERATAEAGEPSHFRYPPRRSLWFRWTAPQSGPVVFHDHGFVIQPALAAYTGDRVDALTRVPVTREFLGDGHYRFTFTAAAGVIYRLALDEDDYWGYGTVHRLHWFFGAEDRTPPAVALTAPADGARVSGITTLDATAADASGIFSVGYSHDIAATRHDGPLPEPPPYAFGLDTERYRDGPLQLTASALDNQANPAVSAPRTMVIDNRPPSVSAWSLDWDQLTALPDIDLRWGSDEPLAQSRCSLDGAIIDCGPITGPPGGELAVHGLADGVHVFAVTATDAFGHPTPDPGYYQWVVDTKGLGVPLLDDAAAPTVGAPVSDLTGGSIVGYATAPVRIRWTGTDGSGTGIQRYEVQASLNGGAYATKASPGTSTAISYQLAPGGYRFRVRAWDWAGNVSGWAYGSYFTVALAQESSTAWSWSTGWSRIATSAASGGYYRLTGTTGASARLTVRGRSVAVYGPKGPTLGLAAVYLDGVRVATINQWYPSGVHREPLYVRNGLSTTTTHVLQIRSLGTAGHTGGGTRVALDAASVVR